MTERRAVPDASARHAYDAWHGRHEVDAAADAPWHRLLKRHLDVARDVAGKRVLEIACGRGGFACWLGTQTRTPGLLAAADFAPAAVNAARRFARETGARVHWEVGDIEALAHPASAFDTVFCCETIEHVPHPTRALRELARVLRPGGRLFLTAPNYLGLMGAYRAYLRLTGRRYTEEGQPINHALVLPRTVRWVRSAGLTIETVDGTGHYLPFPGRSPIALAACERPRWLMRWVALHGLVIAAKPRAAS